MENMIPVDGGTVWAQDTGGPGPVVVLLHPGIGDSIVWDAMMPRLSARYRVIRFDARGHGRSAPATVPYSLLGDLITVLDELDVQRATFCGCSQGGAMSLDLTLAQPERVGALVLVSPGVSGYQWPDDPDADAEYERISDGDIDGLIAWGLGVWAAGATDEASVAQLRSAASAWVANGEFEQAGQPALGRLGEISVPSVLLVGDKDYPPLIEADMAIVSRLPGCELIEVPGGDHLLPLRVPDLIADQVERLTPAG